MESTIDERGSTFLSFGKSSPFYIVTCLLIKHDKTLAYVREKKFKEILLGETGINRLNPLFYLGFLIGSFMFLSGMLFHRLLPLNARAYVYPPLLIILSVVGGTYALLYLLTELTLNSLHTLFVEPFIFAYEVIHQLVTHWSVEFTYTPTEDYLKVNKMLVAIGNNQPGSGKSYSTKELTLIETREEEISFYKKHHESFFFKFYKDTTLFNKDPVRIAKSYSLFVNLYRSTYFSKKELPKDVLRYTANTCFKLDSLDIEKKEEDCTTTRSTFH